MTWEDLLEKIRDRREFDSDTVWTETGDIVAAIIEQVEANRQALARLEASGSWPPDDEVVIDSSAIEVIELPPAAQGESPEEVAENLHQSAWFGGSESYD